MKDIRVIYEYKEWIFGNLNYYFLSKFKQI